MISKRFVIKEIKIEKTLTVIRLVFYYCLLRRSSVLVLFKKSSLVSLEYCASFLDVHVMMICVRMLAQHIDYKSMAFLKCAHAGELVCCNLLRISYHKTKKKMK